VEGPGQSDKSDVLAIHVKGQLPKKFTVRPPFPQPSPLSH